jgi:hypothetical protein
VQSQDERGETFLSQEAQMDMSEVRTGQVSAAEEKEVTATERPVPT